MPGSAKTRRRLLTIALAPLGLVVLLLLAAWVWRAALIEGLLRDRIEALGIGPARLGVSEAGFSSLALRDIAIGPDEELTAERVEIDYALLDGALTAVRVQGPRLKLDLRSGGPPLGGLQPLLEGGEDGGGGGLALPGIRIENGRIEATTPLGPASVAVDGALEESGGDGALAGAFQVAAEAGPARLSGELAVAMAADGALDARLAIREGAIALAAEAAGVSAAIGGLTGSVEASIRDDELQRLAGTLALTDLGLDSARFREANLDFTLAGETLNAEGSLSSADDGLRMAFRGLVEEIQGEPAVSLGLSLAASAEAQIFELVTLPVSRGTGTLALSLRGHLPALARFGKLGAGGTTAEQLLAWSFGGDIAGRFETHLADLLAPERVTGLSLDAKGGLVLADGAAAVTFDAPEPGAAAGGTTGGGIEGASGQATAIEASWLDSLGLPEALVEALAALAEPGLAFDIAPAEPLPAALTLRPLPSAWELVIDGRLGLHPAGDASPEGRGSGTAGAAATGPALALALRQGQVTLGDGLVFLDLPDLALTGSALRLSGVPLSSLSLLGGAFGQPDDLQANLVLAARVERLRPADLDLGGLSLGGVALELPLTATLLGGAFEAFADGEGNLSIARLSHPSGLSLAGPARITLRDGTLLSSPAGVEGTGGGGLTHDLRLGGGPLSLVMVREGEPDLPIRFDPGRLRVIGERPNGGRYRGRASLEGGGLEIPELSTTLKKLDLRLDYDGSFAAPKASFTGELSYLALPALALEGEARRSGSRVTFDAAAGAAGTEAGGQLALQGARPSLNGQYDLDSGVASFTLAPLRLGFAPGQLQPGDLMPQLAELSGVTGSAALQAAGTWAEGRLSGQGRLVLEELSFSREDLKVSGLTLDLALDSLWPPHSPPGQRVTLRRIDAAAAVEGLDARFQLLPGAPAKALIETLDFGLAGGRYRLRQTLIDPAAERQNARLEVVEMNLEQLFGLLDIEGLDGGGKLQGVLPLSIAGSNVLIQDGQLDAVGPGWLSYRRASRRVPPPEIEENAAELLQDPLELTQRALENFQFSRLSIGVDKAADGNAELAVALEGNNPDLLDGYPFRFNINLAGNLNPVLTALEQGLNLSQDLLGQSWRISQ